MAINMTLDSLNLNLGLQSGYDVIMTAPGLYVEHKCIVCSELMDKKSNVDGPTGWAEAMAQRSHLHDVYTCPHAGKDWHNQCIALMKEIDRTSSAKITELLKQELKEILVSRKVTK